MKGLIVLSRREAHRGHVLERVAQRTLTLKEAAKIMGLSYRQTRRVHKRWQEYGLASLCHRNRGHQARHAMPGEMEAIILAFHKEVYASFNDTLRLPQVQQASATLLSELHLR